MLKLVIPDAELFNEETEEFITIKSQVLTLEHSLVSVSKWESKWRKSFFRNEEKTREEWVYYIKCMTKTQNVNPLIYENIPQEALDKILEYIKNPMTATWFSEDNNKPAGRETVTSELIYYWMIALNIPFECQKWHLNRLFTLIQICEIKNNAKKMTTYETQRQNAELNKIRRAKMNSKG